MKRFSLLMIMALAAAGAPVRAADAQTIDLGNGTTVEVRDGRVTVNASSDSTASTDPSASGGASSASATSSTRTDALGQSVTTVTTERNGQRVTRTITVGKDGAITVSDPGEPGGATGDSAAQAKPAPPAPASGWLGVHSVPVTDALRAQIDIPDDQGVVMEFVAEGGPAAAAGLRAHDIVLALDGSGVGSVDAFRGRLAATKPGQQVVIEYVRKGKRTTTTATLGERPPDAAAGAKVAGEAGRLLQQLEAAAPSVRRGVVIDGEGQAHVVENGDPFDLLLNDPNVPEAMKSLIRESQRKLKQALPEPLGEEATDR